MSDVSLSFSFIERPALPHLRLPNLLETYNIIHSTVFDAEEPASKLKQMLDASYINYVRGTQSIEDLALILFYGDYSKADTEEKLNDFKNSLNRKFPPESFNLDLPKDFVSCWVGKK